MNTISEYTNNNVKDINIFEQYTTYWNRNSSKLGNYFWRDILLVGSFLLGAITIPLMGILSKTFSNAEKRKRDNGEYIPYDPETLEYIRNKNIRNKMVIGKINEKRFDAYIELSKNEKDKNTVFENINNRKQECVIMSNKDKHIKLGYVGGFINNCCFMLGLIVVGKKTITKDNKTIYTPIILLEIDKTTENIDYVIETMINKLVKDKELCIHEGAYIKIENIDDINNNKEITESLIKNLGFDEIKDKEFGKLFFYTKSKHMEAKKIIAKEKEKNKNA